MKQGFFNLRIQSAFLHLLFGLSLVLSSAAVTAATATIVDNSLDKSELTLLQVLKDGVNNVDGLGNPRDIKMTPKHVFVASGDDDSISMFRIQEDSNTDLNLTYINSLSYHKDKRYGLQGASSLVLIGAGDKMKVAVASFYSGAVSSFDINNGDTLTFSSTISDAISPEKVFKEGQSVNKKDHYGLLGAWEIAQSHNKQTLFVTGYKSNAISVFFVEGGQLHFNQKLGVNYDLGNPIGIVTSPIANEVIVAGFEKSLLSVFRQNAFGKYEPVQRIEGDVDGGISKSMHFSQPQKLIISPNGKYLYVACAGSHQVLMFERTLDKIYVFKQSVTNEMVGGAGLTGAGSLAISPDGKTLYAAGEADSGILVFSVNTNGTLEYRSKQLTAGGDSIKGVSMLYLSPNGEVLFVGTGKNNALYVFKTR